MGKVQWDNNFWLPIEKYGELGRDETLSRLQGLDFDVGLSVGCCLSVDDLKVDMLQRCQNSGQMTNFHFKHKKIKWASTIKNQTQCVGLLYKADTIIILSKSN
jgi:hypothetical protein